VVNSVDMMSFRDNKFKNAFENIDVEEYVFDLSTKTMVLKSKFVLKFQHF
jgi:hypothetical protein